MDDGVKIHQVSVKFGTIHAGELDFVAHLHATAAAHAGAIDHDGVEADRGTDAIGLGQVCNRPHHEKRSDCQNVIKMLTGFDELAKLISYEAMKSEGAIIGR